MKVLMALCLASVGVLTGCGGGGDSSGAAFVVQTQFPAYDGRSSEPLARSKSVWINLKSSSTGEVLWTNYVNRPSDAGGEVVRRMGVDAPSIDVQVTACADVEGGGAVIGSKVVRNQPLGSNVVVASLK